MLEKVGEPDPPLDWEEIDRDDRSRTLRLTIQPKQEIMSRSHLHRSKHGVVTKGTAEITVDGEPRIVHEDEYFYVPTGSIYCLKNPGIISLVIVEIWIGSYLEDDDVVYLSGEQNK